jgi:hypothetical protein
VLRSCVFLLLLPTLPLLAQEPRNLLENRDQWRQIHGADASFVLKDQTLSIERADAPPAAILTREEYENFDLSFDFWYAKDEENGIYLHAPWNGAFRAGLEIELGDHSKKDPTVYTSGAIYRHVPAKVMAVTGPDQWQTCRIHMDWPHLVVHINDQLVQDIDLAQHPELRHTLRRGAIGFANSLGWGFKVRNLLLTPLPDTEPRQVLFGGDNIDQWVDVRPKDAKWRVENGALVSDTGYGYLQHPFEAQDFDLHLYYKAERDANGGVFFRWLADDSDRGNEIQIMDLPDTAMPSGSIYNITRANDALITPGEWTLLQLHVRGKHATTWLNGMKCAETDALEKVQAGRITLQMHRNGAGIRFKDIVLTPTQ